MTDQKPSVGRIVHYVLSQGDVAHINEVSPQVIDGRQVRNAVHAGDVLAAIVVRTFGSTAANLRVLLDGAGDHWATSRCAGANDEHGRWHWPERV